MTHFGKNLRRIAFDRNIAVAEIARRAGLTPSCLYQIIYGRRKPMLETAAAIAFVLRVSIDELVRRK